MIAGVPCRARRARDAERGSGPGRRAPPGARAKGGAGGAPREASYQAVCDMSESDSEPPSDRP